MHHALAHARRSALHFVFGFIAQNNVAAERLVEAEGWIRVGPINPPPKMPGSPPFYYVVYPVPPE
jgi:hypothetical protein